MFAIEVSDLQKHYGSVAALAGFDLRVPQGCLLGFLGPNGAGKTTTLRILMGFIRSSAGTARVLGMHAWRDATRIHSLVGYLPGDVRFPDWHSGRAFLEFCDAMRGGGHMAEAQRLLTRFGLNARRRIREYSRGMLQKLGLVQAMMHRPPLLIMDEPSTALDPLVLEVLYDEIRAITAEGRTVLFSSHILSEVERLCDRVAIIRDGRLIEDSTITELRSRAIRRVEFRPTRQNAGDHPFPSGFEPSESVEGLVAGAWKGQTDELLAWLRAVGAEELTISPPSLEDLFRTYYS